MRIKKAQLKNAKRIFKRDLERPQRKNSARVSDDMTQKLKSILTHKPLASLQIVLKKSKLKLIEKYNPSPDNLY